MADNKINEIQHEISSVTDQVRDNIDLVIARGEHLDDLGEKSEMLHGHSKMFSRQARRLKWKMWMKNVKMALLIIFIILLIIFFFLFMICG